MSVTYKRLTLNITEDVYAELQRLADEMTSGSVTGLIKQAVALQKFAWDHRDGELLLKQGGKVRQIIVQRAS